MKLIKTYADYDHWANNILLNHTIEAGEEMLDKEMPSSFKTIRATWGHIRDAERVWTARITNKEIPRFTGWSESESIENFSGELLSISAWLAKIIEEANLEWLKFGISYSNSKGQAFSQTREQILMHVFNHSTYHRGQIVNMLRQAGTSNLASTDLITFFREENKA